MLTYRRFLGAEAGPGMQRTFAAAVNAAIELSSPIVGILPGPLRTELELTMLDPYFAARPSSISKEDMAETVNKARSVADGMTQASISLLRSETSIFGGRMLDWPTTLNDFLWRCAVEAIYAACIMDDVGSTDEAFRNAAQKVADGNIGLIVRNYEETLLDDDNFRKRYIIVRRAIHDAARYYLKHVA
jgi:hypothetical protein